MMFKGRMDLLENPTLVPPLPFSLSLSLSTSFTQLLLLYLTGRFICTADFPYGIIYANKSWTRMTDYQQHEIEGKDLCFMQGALTDSVSLKHVRVRLYCLSCHSHLRLLTHFYGLKSDDV